jgi:hypothetical protein
MSIYSIESLPTEILLNIVHVLSKTDQNNLARVSRCFHQVVRRYQAAFPSFYISSLEPGFSTGISAAIEKLFLVDSCPKKSDLCLHALPEKIHARALCELKSVFPNIQTLLLPTEKENEDAVAGSISDNWPDLKQLYFNRGFNLSHQGFLQLMKLKSLESLQISLLPYEDQTLPKPPLTDAQDPIDDQTFQSIAELTRLVELDFTANEHLTDAAITSFTSLTCLTYLSLNMIHLTNVGLESLCTLSSLKDLSLIGCLVDDDGITHLAKLPHLACLKLHDIDITKRGLKKLGQLPQLTTLELSAMGESNPEFRLPCKTLKYLSFCSKLQQVTLSDCSLPKSLDCHYLSQMPLMAHLVLIDTMGIRQSDIVAPDTSHCQIHFRLT